MLAQLPAVTKANTRKAGVDVKEMVLFQVPITWKMGNSCLKAHCSISGQADVFIRREKGKQNKDQGRGCKVLYRQTSTVHSNESRDGPMFLILVSSSWIHGGRAANLLELGCLKVGVCIF